MPDYYAPGTYEREGQLIGTGMTLLPADAVVILARSNDSPLAWLENQDPAYNTSVSIVNDEQVNFKFEEAVFNLPVYIGALVSSDRQTIYWVNRTRPLP